MSYPQSLSLLTLAGLAAGCGAASVNSNSSQGFSADWQNDGGRSIAALEQRLHALPVVPNARIVVGLTDTGLSGATLDGKSHWAHAGKEASPP
ncbi:MAG TPA: hypothetical protein VIK01_27335, partial [Polyangiaceae bacterium]